MTLVSRAHAVSLVHEIMQCRYGPNGEHPPILIFEGGRGSGKTALITGIAELLDRRVPYARIDLDAGAHTGMPEVLSALAFQLGKPCPLYGTLRFPRLAVGQLVMNLPNLSDDRAEARDQIAALLLQNRPIRAWTEALRTNSGGLAAALPPELQTPGALAPGMLADVIDGLYRWRWSRRRVLNRAQKWYGRWHTGLRTNPEDELINLHQWHQPPAKGGNATSRDKLLWAAFRADLRASLGRRLHHGWLPRCVILIDNADTRIGRHVLDQLRQLRAVAEREDSQPGKGGPTTDPLVVVATSRTPFDHPSPHEQYVLVPGKRLKLPSAAPGGGPEQGGEPWPRWVRYPLPNLTSSDVAQKIEKDYRGPDRRFPSLVQLDHRIPMLIQQFAQGNPLTVSMLLQAADQVKEPATWLREGNELGRLLDPKEPEPTTEAAKQEQEQEQVAIGEQLGRSLLGIPDDTPFESDQIECLITCAAARNRTQALVLAERSGLADLTKYNRLTGPMLDSLWPPGQQLAASPLRRLLLRRLAERAAGSKADWTAVHGWLRQYCADHGDRVGELYHALAVADVEYVATSLAERSSTETADGWVATVLAVVQAPTNRPHDPSPLEEADRLAGGLGIHTGNHLQTIRQLVAMLWVGADPFTGRQRAGLHDEIVTAYKALRTRFTDYSALEREIGRHKELAGQWH